MGHTRSETSTKTKVAAVKLKIIANRFKLILSNTVHTYMRYTQRLTVIFSRLMKEVEDDDCEETGNEVQSDEGDVQSINEKGGNKSLKNNNKDKHTEFVINSPGSNNIDKKNCTLNLSFILQEVTT